MNVLQNLIELYNHLPSDSTYRGVVQGILMNLETVINSTIYDVAEITNSSKTTVWRMIQKMGYQSFTEFRLALKQAVSNYTYYNRIVPAKMVADDNKVVEIITHQLQNASIEIESFLSDKELLNMVKQLADISQISFYFPYQSSAISSFQQNLSMVGKKTGTYCLLPDMLEDAERLDTQSLVFCATIEHAEVQDLTKVFELLKKQGVKIAMAASEESRYKEYVDWYLFPRWKENTVLSSLIVCEMYFFALNEMFRKYYIKD